MDTFVTHPLNPSIPFGHVQTGTEALSQTEQKKRTKNEPLCKAVGVQFEPFGLTTFGRLSDSAQVILHDLIAALPEASQRDAHANRQQQLQLALKREVAGMLLQGAHQADVPLAPEPASKATQLSGQRVPGGGIVIRTRRPESGPPVLSEGGSLSLC